MRIFIYVSFVAIDCNSANYWIFRNGKANHCKI